MSKKIDEMARELNQLHSAIEAVNHRSNIYQAETVEYRKELLRSIKYTSHLITFVAGGFVALVASNLMGIL